MDTPVVTIIIVVNNNINNKPSVHTENITGTHNKH